MGSSRRWGKADLVALAFLAGLAVALLAPFVFRGRVPLNTDLVVSRHEPWWRHYPELAPHNDELDDPAFYIYPVRELSASLLRRGVVPLWNPYILCGTPLMADGVSLPFDPFGLLALALPFPTAWGAMVLAQLLVAGGSMFLLMRTYRCSPPAAALSAAALMLSGTFTVWLEYISWIGAFCWAPLCLLCLDAGVRRGRTLPFVGAGVLLAFTVLGGLLQLSLYFFAMMGFYAVWQMLVVHRAGAGWRSTGANAGRLLLAFLLAGLLAGVQLVPTLELASLTYRAAHRYVGANQVSVAELVTYLAPNLYGHPALHDPFAHLVAVPNFLTRHGGYVGVLPLVLAVVALGGVRRRPRVACHAALAFGSVGLLVVLGLGLERVVMSVFPAFGSVHAKRLVVVYSVSASVLAGFGLDALLASGEGGRRRAARAVGLAALAGVLLVMLLDGTGRAVGPGEGSGLRAWVEEARRLAPGGLLVLFYGVGVPLGLLGAAWGLLRFGPRLGRGPWAVLLVAFAAGDLLAQARLYNPFVPRELVYPRTPTTEWLAAREGTFRISGVSPPVEPGHPRLDWWARRFKGDTLPPNTAMPYRLADVRGRSSLFPGWVREYAQAATGNPDIRVLMDYRAAEHRGSLVARLAPRYVVSPQPLEGEEFALRRRGPPGIYEHRAAPPRVYVAGRAEVVEDDRAALARLVATPAGTDTVVLDRELPATDAEQLAAAELASEQPNEVRVRIVRPGCGYLVLADTWYPGWQVRVDGERRPMARANYLMRCVALRPGDREVVFAFEPASFRWGLALSVTGLALACAVGVGARVRRRREAGA
ncbi:MAG: hypothetical protein ACLF0G_06905 [Candidatus Brocadiia bacterium]